MIVTSPVEGSSEILSQWEVDTNEKLTRGRTKTWWKCQERSAGKTSPWPTMKLTMKKCVSAKACHQMVRAALHWPANHIFKSFPHFYPFLPGSLLTPDLLGSILVPNYPAASCPPCPTMGTSQFPHLGQLWSISAIEPSQMLHEWPWSCSWSWVKL